MATMTFDFPQSLTEKYRPRKIAEFVGIPKAKNVRAALMSLESELLTA